MADYQQLAESPKKSRRPGESDDIAAETYKGPSPAVAAAGEGAISHFLLGAVGLGIGFIISYFAHEPLAKFIENARAYGLRLMKESKGESNWGKIVVSAFGHGNKDGGFSNMVRKNAGHPAWKIKLADRELVKMEHGWLYNFSNEIRELPGIRQLLGMLGTTEAATDRVNTAIMGGGLLGAFGFFIAPIAFWVTGVKHANQGKRQFNRAKEELAETREKYDSLREKYTETRGELEEQKAVHGEPRSELGSGTRNWEGSLASAVQPGLPSA